MITSLPLVMLADIPKPLEELEEIGGAAGYKPVTEDKPLELVGYIEVIATYRKSVLS
ncbi:MAG: hypothetical protein AB1414_20940 [bacterium]